jgi:hypothetical protein
MFIVQATAASFCHQAAALVPDRFHNFYFLKNDNIVKMSRDILSLDFLPELNYNQILLNKVSHIYLETTRLFTG